MVKATVDIRDELLAQARAQAARERTTLAAVVEIWAFDVQLGGRASARAGLLELLEPVNKYRVEELKWRPLHGTPPVSPQGFTRLALEDLLSPDEANWRLCLSRGVMRPSQSSLARQSALL